MRLDLQVASPQSGSRRVWGVKDPVTLNYYELREEEFFVLGQLERPMSVGELCTAFAERFRPQTLAHEELQQFIGQLSQQGLLIAEQPGYGNVLSDRIANADTRRRWQGLTNLLAIRFRGFDPDRLLGSILTRCEWLFSPWTLIIFGLVTATAIGLVILEFDTLVSRLPDAKAWLSVQNLFLMAFVLGCVKVLHEFGHGLTCKRFGGECHEMGLMLLVFTPCLYCNVTDIWMVKSKWQRMAVSAAGIAVELAIAACCTILWWFSVPGLFHSVCLNLMVVCGVSTLVFNGNPLLRYDGYFVLSDWLEIPNLQQQSLAAVKRHLAGWFLGLSRPSSRPVPAGHEMLLVAYGAASLAYRLLLTVSVLWVLYYWLQPYGLAPVVHVFAALTAWTTLAMPMSNLLQWLMSPAQRVCICWPRFFRRGMLAIILLATVLLVPLPSHVTSTALFDSDAAARVYVTSEGTLVEGVTIGSVVEEGQVVAKLVSPQLERELARLEGEVQEHRVRLEQLERRRVHEQGVAAQIPSTRESLHEVEQQLERRRLDADRLVLRAPRSGVVVPAFSTNRSPAGSLPGWSSTPLDPRTRGCFLRAGTTVCLIGERSKVAATLIVSQDGAADVRIGQSVRLRCPEFPGEVLQGEIVELAELDIDLVTTDFVRRANLPTRIASSGTIRPVGIWYQARASISQSDDRILPGTSGTGTISIGSESLLTRSRRWIRRTFSL